MVLFPPWPPRPPCFIRRANAGRGLWTEHGGGGRFLASMGTTRDVAAFADARGAPPNEAARWQTPYPPSGPPDRFRVPALRRRIPALGTHATLLHGCAVPDRPLTNRERTDLFAPLLADVRARLTALSAGDDELLRVLRRKLARELGADERGKPMQRAVLKMQKRIEQRHRCASCAQPLPDRGVVLDRLVAVQGCTKANTRLVCPACAAEARASRSR